MNIDDLKGAWGKDEPTGMHLPNSTALLGKSTSAITRIRKNMKSEFFGILASYALLIYYVAMVFVYGSPAESSFLNVMSILLFTVIVLSVFYYSRFYFFYRTITRYDLNMKESIRKIAYELELNTEIYKTYNFCVTPLAVMIAITLLGFKSALNTMQHILTGNVFVSPWSLLFVFAVILISFAVTYFCINWHVRTQYGKYLAELKQVVDDLEDEG